MKICITSYGNNLDSNVDPRFGRCAYFIIIDPETMEFEAIENLSAQTSGGAGIQAGQLISEKKAEAVLTGNVGPNAYQTLSAAGIKIFTQVTGSIGEAVNKFNNNELIEVDNATVESHFGMQSGK
ncbi:MAG: NifB/NifX family molybdenum-iron cluster-binding protein [Spirochaetes bacterium]|nr:NifB/NifX family molybdenum-iron cluster-binding protein [Spirochaetota bacterium]